MQTILVNTFTFTYFLGETQLFGHWKHHQQTILVPCACIGLLERRTWPVKPPIKSMLCVCQAASHSLLIKIMCTIDPPPGAAT